MRAGGGAEAGHGVIPSAGAAAAALAAAPTSAGTFKEGAAFEPDGARAATMPPEARGLARDGVRLLVAGRGGLHDAGFRQLPRFLRAGDLLVVNDSATLPAAADAQREDGSAVVVHFSTHLGPGEWAVELRPPGRATGPVEDARAEERVRLPGELTLSLQAPWPATGAARPRLWRVKVAGGRAVTAVLRRHGRPIAYAYVEGRWPLAAYQTVFARQPGSAEMPSAARPFSHRLVTSLALAGVGFAPITLHTGVSSPGPGESPLPERFAVPESTAERVNASRRAGGRVIAVGTTVTRALETVASAGGHASAGSGWTELVLSPDRPARVVDALITGWHAPGSSHLLLLQAVAGAETVGRAYAAAAARGYLWHEFGDSCLLLP